MEKTDKKQLFSQLNTMVLVEDVAFLSHLYESTPHRPRLFFAAKKDIQSDVSIEQTQPQQTRPFSAGQ